MRALRTAGLLSLCALALTGVGRATEDAPVQTMIPDTPPEIFPPVARAVGVGQTLNFSIAAIDQDLDETAVHVVTAPASAVVNEYTQMISFTPTAKDVGTATFELRIDQNLRSGASKSTPVTWKLEVTKQKQVFPVAPEQSPMIETLLMIRQPERLVQVNKDWPLERMLLVGAEGFKWQFSEENRAKLDGKLDSKVLYNQFLGALAQTHANDKLNPKSHYFDRATYGDSKDWQIVAFRPRIDRAWVELRVVYRNVKAPEPVFAMFRLRPTVEYVPAGPRPPEERAHNNKTFLGMVAKHLLVDGAPNPKFVKDKAAHGKAVSQLMTDVLTYDQSSEAPYKRGFMIGIALEAQLGGGSTLNADGSYRSGDAWAWSAMKPFQSGSTQVYQNVVIPGFWTKVQPTPDGGWGPVCGPRWNEKDPKHARGFQVLCRKTLGFVDLPATSGGKVVGGRIDANNLYVEHKTNDSVRDLALDDGRRDVGEENGMTCSQCHIRTFAMHDYGDKANTDSSLGTPSTRNKKIRTLNFQIVPSTHWEEFTLEFLKHQECRAKQLYTQFLGADAAKGFGCPLAPT